MHDVVPTIES